MDILERLRQPAQKLGLEEYDPTFDCRQEAAREIERHSRNSDLQMQRAIRAEAEAKRLREALTAIAGFGDVNLSGEWEAGLRDIIRSMTERAKSELTAT